MSAFWGAVIGMILGIVAGIFLAPISDRITEIRKRRNLLKHMQYDLGNAQRHFGYVLAEMPEIKKEPKWRQLSRFQWMKFASRGFLTSPRNDLYALNDNEADKFMALLVLFENFDEVCDTSYQLHLASDPQSLQSVDEIVRRAKEIRTDLSELKTVIDTAVLEWKWWRV